MNLLKHGLVTRLSNAVAAGTGTTNVTARDMKGYRSCTFYVAIGSITASGTVTLHIEQSEDNSSCWCSFS